MDLGTMQKKLKSAQYKNKAQFQHDLNLIWDNCFLYNASPTHPLRRSAAQMRKKANHLLEFLSEKSEIKDMLSHWQPPAPAEHVKERDSSPSTTPIVPEAKATHAKPVDIAKPRGIDAPFAQRVALRRSSDSTLVFSELDARLASPAIQGNSGASTSSSIDTLFESRKLSKTMSILGQVRQSSHVAPLQSALQLPASLEDSTISAPEALQAWWTSCGSDAMLCAGLPSLRHSGTGNHQDRKSMPDVSSRLPLQRPGIPRTMAKNIQTLRRLHHTHQKFFWLAEVVEHELPIPADLAQVSSDEEEEHGRDFGDDMPDDDDDIQDELGRELHHTSKRLALTGMEPSQKRALSQNKSTTPSHIPESTMRTSLQPKLLPDAYPFPRLTQRYAREQVSWQVELILAHTGLDGSQVNALQVLTDVTCDYMMGLARNLRLYTDRYATQMRAEEMIQHTLQSSGGTCVEKLHSYIRTDIERYGVRLREWLRKLRVAYRDQLTNIGRAVVEDDELLARDGEALSLGHFAEGLGEDFFGFRELGLDRELGLAGLAVPRRLFYGTSTSTNLICKPREKKPQAAPIGKVVARPLEKREELQLFLVGRYTVCVGDEGFFPLGPWMSGQDKRTSAPSNGNASRSGAHKSNKPAKHAGKTDEPVNMPKHANARNASPAHSINFGTVDDQNAVLSSSPAAQPSAGKHLQGGNPTVFGSVAAEPTPMPEKKGKKLDFQKLFQGQSAQTASPNHVAHPANQAAGSPSVPQQAGMPSQRAGPPVYNAACQQNDKLPFPPQSQPGTPMMPNMAYPSPQSGPQPWHGSPMYPHVGYPMSPGGFPYMPQQPWQPANSPHLAAPNMPGSPMHAANSPRGPAMIPRPAGAQPFYPPGSPSPSLNNYTMNAGARHFEPQKSKALRIVNPDTHTELDLEQVRQKSSSKPSSDQASSQSTAESTAATPSAASSEPQSHPGTPQSSHATPSSTPSQEQTRVKTQADFQQRVLRLKMEREKAEREKKEKEQAEQLAAERETEEKQRIERETIEREKQQKEAAEKKAAEHKAAVEAEKQQAEKLAAEKAQAEKQAAEKAQAEKQAADKAAEEKKAAEKAAAEKEQSAEQATDRAAATKLDQDKVSVAETALPTGLETKSDAKPNASADEARASSDEKPAKSTQNTSDSANADVDASANANASANADADTNANANANQSADKGTYADADASANDDAGANANANTNDSENASENPDEHNAADTHAEMQFEASTSTGQNRALEKAQPIEHLEQIHYPESVQAPDAKLNVGTSAGKFRYDRDFLLQFMSVYTEKPADLPLLASIGMESVAGGRGGRRGGMGGAGRGGAMTGGRGGAGRTSEERFNAANRGGFGGGGMNSFSGQRGQGLSRNGSGGPLPSRETMGTGVPMGARPKSNRGRQRGPHVNPPEKGGPTIPMDQVAPLAYSENRWKPQSKDENAKKDADQTLQVERKVKSLLNKLTVEKFESISDQIVAFANQSANETDGRTLRQVIALVFEKAIDEAAWSEMYAQLCAKIQVNLNQDIRDEVLDQKEGKEYRGGFLFRKYLLTWCQGDFEKGWGAAKDDKKPEQEPELLSDEYYAEQKAKRRGLGLVQFVGELFKLQMLQPRIMHTCIVRLLRTTTEPEEDEIESVCRLLSTVGGMLDASGGNNKSRMDVYFKRIDDILQSPNISSRMRFMLLDVVDMRNDHWRPRHDSSAPKTIAEIHADAAKKQQQKEAEKFGRHDSLSRGGSRRGQTREPYTQQGAVGADGWSTVGGGASAPPPRQGRTGDLSGFGKGIERSSSGKLSGGPQSIFSRKNQRSGTSTPDSDSRSPSRASSKAGNMFNLLNASQEGGEEAQQRPKLQLQPRSTSATNLHDAATSAQSDAPPDAEPSEEDLNRKVANDVKEYLAIRDVEEGVQSIQALDTQHRSKFVDALVAAVLDKKPDVVQDAGKLLKTLRERDVLTEEQTLEGFKPQLTYLDDTSMDAPSAYSFMAQLLVDANFSREQIDPLADVIEGEGIKPPKDRLLAKVDDLL
ncbi:hypothetical protein MYAM1_002954 [Malassezia yamatoensis]|uniref:MI domain-containing protein n=1 Tax=Malassezia yamatoensis TaxID=253288 RepID=A0AAJ5YVI4_9BASI|nr:hypothetical protein MYAM1_002954 [Malassezia yamatoensis]